MKKFLERKSLEKLREFYENEEVKQFRDFHAAVVARFVSYLFPERDATKAPHYRRVLVANALVRAATQAARRSAEAVGMFAKVDTGQRTRSHGRVLEVGTVVAMTPTLRRRMRVRNNLRMLRPDGRTVERLVRIKRVHRLADREVG